jgi:hypothetical protein
MNRRGDDIKTLKLAMKQKGRMCERTKGTIQLLFARVPFILIFSGYD